MPIITDRHSLASTIGLYILNFSTLDLLVQDYLDDNLPDEEFAQLKDHRHFRDRIERIRQHVKQPGFDSKKGAEFEHLASRLEPIRKLRNHIAHGVLRASMNQDTKEWDLTISLPRDMDGSNKPDARHLTFKELLKASKELTTLIEDFKSWTAEWLPD
jgi:hypothetical protein